ncbi:adhesion G protein-coupled receptor B3-like isoform X2 [Haliotis rubra]|uniref:adhesion G protein-coupled receptor B3-like isoform X2 n=1 Tax=Haliotis rubra TaxID=36100 RepID=UPI001EE5258C|nr:adhesion G protein-coupled receptor B3-like isoform X2 [Haliotis rubra]
MLLSVDGVWNGWETWGDCSNICGGGMRSRTRTCQGPFFQGAPCLGEVSHTEECNTFECPVDGSWLPWHDWRDCSVTCGGGQQIRKRDCLKPKFGGSNCEGESQQTRQCSTQECPVDGVWREWNEWSACSRRCDTGTQTRNRTCDGPYFGGSDCVGPTSDLRNCNTHTCAVPGDWFNWEQWAACSVTCGGGTKSRSRKCDMTSHGKLTSPCEGVDEETIDCHTFACTPLGEDY